MITIKEEFLTCDKLRRAVDAAGSDAVVMWLAMKLYTVLGGTDGFVPDEEIDKLPGGPRRHPRKALEALVLCGRRLKNGARGAGLADKTEYGWQLHDYLDHAESAEDTKERRRLEADRKRRYRAKKLNESVPAVPLSRMGHDAGQTADAGTNVPHVPHGTGRGRDVGTGRGLSSQPNPTLSNPSDPTGEGDPRPDRSEPPDPPSGSFFPRSDPMAYMAGQDPTQRADVQRLHARWRELFGYPAHSFRGYGDRDAQTLADALDTYGEDACLLVLEYAPRDGMVNGEDDQRKKHDSIGYIFGNNDAFNRILRSAQRMDPDEQGKRRPSEAVGELLQQGRLE
jgi:hypothetical protein